jgi:hypothetical protein
MVSPSAAQTNGRFFVPSAPPFRGLMAADSGYIIENPRMIVGPGVDIAAFSPNGRFLIAARREVEIGAGTAEAEIDRQERSLPIAISDSSVTVSLVLYNAISRHASVVWSARANADTTLQLRLIGWFGGSSRAIATLHSVVRQPDGKTTEETSVLFINAEKGTVQESPLLGDTYVGLYPSEKNPFAALVNPEGGPDADLPNAKGGKDSAVQFLRGDGTLTDPIRLPSFIWFSRWSDDGTELRGKAFGAEVDGHAPELWYAVNPATGVVRSISTPPHPTDTYEDQDPVPPALLPPSLPFHWATHHAASTTATPSTSAPDIELESADGKEQIAIAAEGTPLALTRQAAVYSIDGALYAAPIQKIGQAAYLRLKDDGIRAKVKERARQLAMALGMYAFAHDRFFPPADADLLKTLGKNVTAEELEGFVYTPPANRAMPGAKASPASLGTIHVPGGRMVLYTNSRVDFEADK